MGLANCLQKRIESFLAMISKLGQASTCEILYYSKAQRNLTSVTFQGHCLGRQDLPPGSMVLESCEERLEKSVQDLLKERGA